MMAAAQPEDALIRETVQRLRELRQQAALARLDGRFDLVLSLEDQIDELRFRATAALVRQAARPLQAGRDLQHCRTADVLEMFGLTRDQWKRVSKKHKAALRRFKRGHGKWYRSGLLQWGREERLIEGGDA